MCLPRSPLLLTLALIAACGQIDPPTLSSVSISPDPATTTDALRCEAVATPVEGAVVTIDIAWTVDQQPAGDASETLPAAAFIKGQQVACTATPRIGEVPGEPGVAEVTIVNTPPVVQSITIGPDPATTGDELSCNVTTADADDDEVSVSVTWEIDGAPVDGPYQAFMAARGAEVACIATPNDGEQDGEPARATLTIANALPAVDAVTITPDPALTLDDLTCAAEASDLDEDPLDLTYTWTIDGTIVGEGAVLGNAATMRGDTVRCEVVANDGVEDGASAFAEVTIGNTPPTSPGVAISPESPLEQADDLVCIVDTASTDPDGDPVTLTFAWEVDGVAFEGATTTTLTGDTVPAIETVDGQTWTCSVTASDGTDTSSPGVAEVEVIGWTGPRAFTTCGRTAGRTGPSADDCAAEYRGTTLEGEVTVVDDGIQEWVVPTTAVYRIEARGAQGGDAGSLSGAEGAILEADIELFEGEVISVLVGQRGESGSGSNPGGGGGGTFVVGPRDAPLLIAGAGTGNGNYGSRRAVTTNDGGAGGAAGGTGGFGGRPGTRGCGGGGLLGDGETDSTCSNRGAPGLGFVNGGLGGASVGRCAGFDQDGGFGGGASNGGSCIPNGGAGGGYSGGGGSSNTAAGGGGSFVASTASNVATSDGRYNGSTSFDGEEIENLDAWNTGVGSVTIDLVE